MHQIGPACRAFIFSLQLPHFNPREICVRTDCATTPRIIAAADESREWKPKSLTLTFSSKSLDLGLCLANVGLALKRYHVSETGALRDYDGRCKGRALGPEDRQPLP